MKKIFPSLLCTLALLLGMQINAQAQVGLSAHVGLDLDASELYIGGDLVFPVTISENRFIGNPSVDVYPFIDNQSVFVLNLDLLYEVLQVMDQYPFLVGAGLGFRRTSVDEDLVPDGLDKSDVDPLLNLLAEVQWLMDDSNFVPYGRVRLAVGSGTGLAFVVGIRFQLGGD